MAAYHAGYSSFAHLRRVVLSRSHHGAEGAGTAMYGNHPRTAPLVSRQTMASLNHSVVGRAYFPWGRARIGGVFTHGLSVGWAALLAHVDLRSMSITRRLLFLAVAMLLVDLAILMVAVHFGNASVVQCHRYC